MAKTKPIRRKPVPRKPVPHGNGGSAGLQHGGPVDLASAENGLTVEGIKYAFDVNLKYSLAKDQYSATDFDNFMAAAYSIRDRMIERWINTQQRYHKQNLKRVYYLSMEFLIGRLFMSSILNLGIKGQAKKGFEKAGLALEELADQEYDAGLGNGGLGRLAACFLDSMATLGIPANGYGIMY
ncbi:MAG: glycogen/starch/alpha-glucan phosphorylase, partial [Armatimonadota bacterium]